MRGRKILSISFVALVAAYGALFTLQTQLDAGAMWSRFEALRDGGYDGRAAAYGDRFLGNVFEADASATDLTEQVHAVADAHYRGGSRRQSIGYYELLLDEARPGYLTDAERVETRRRIAEMELEEGNAVVPALIAARFIERSGDAVATQQGAEGGEGRPRFLELVDAMRTGFTDVLPADGIRRQIEGDRADLLAAADAMTTVGGYYALGSDGAYAAAGLLSAAHDIREAQLGPDHEDTVQAALLLAPAYERIDRLSDAEALYEQVFQAQERARGPNNPELSLYIRLLSGIYEKQGRLTEAEALNRHMRRIFRDAYGAKRYAANQSRDRMFDINRPVSDSFPLDTNYIPPDLVKAASFDIPLSKPSHLEEMQLRRAEIDETTMPEQLAGLLDACSQPGERLSLRSAYRSHKTQVTLHRINGDKGTVADPGTSEHQLGLAADIDVNRRFMRATDRAYACFEKKAWQYGFILSFPPENSYLPGQDSYEPWHWRFVGPRTALLYREIGPWGMPQEFLSVLPCYEERALSGLFLDRERGDICLEGIQTASTDDEGRGT